MSIQLYILFSALILVLIVALLNLNSKDGDATPIQNMFFVAGQAILSIAAFVMSLAIAVEVSFRTFFRVFAADFRKRFAILTQAEGVQHKQSLFVKLASLICLLLVFAACVIMSLAVGLELGNLSFRRTFVSEFSRRITQYKGIKIHVL